MKIESIFFFFFYLFGAPEQVDIQIKSTGFCNGGMLLPQLKTDKSLSELYQVKVQL